jgi:DNA-binding protein YbaB
MPTPPEDPAQAMDELLADIAAFDYTGLDDRVNATLGLLRGMAAEGMDVSEALAQLKSTPTEAQAIAQRARGLEQWESLQAFQTATYQGFDEQGLVAVTIDAQATVTRTEFLDAALHHDGTALAPAVAEAFAAAEAALVRASEQLQHP